jgi:hypothetical protein
MTTRRFAACALACAALSACSTLGGAASPATSGSALLDAVKAISANCTGAFNANLTFAPPLPPSGSLVVNQTCSAPASAAKAAVAAAPAG